MIGLRGPRSQLGFHADLTTLNQLYESGAGVGRWAHWLLSDAAPALLIGLFIISVVTAAIGYLVAAFGWRWWIGRKRRAKMQRLAPIGAAGE